MQNENLPLTGRVALVTGATRGAGRAIALELALAGAEVYATGRSSRRTGPSTMGRSETIEETAELISAAGGAVTGLRCDHSIPEQAAAVVQRIADEHDGQLDVLVNDVWGGDPLARWGQPFWEHPLPDLLALHRGAVETHLITSWYVAPLMVAQRSGLLIEVTDGKDGGFRGNLGYDLAKATVNRLALGTAQELGRHGVTAVGVTPGFLRSEAMLDHFAVTEDTWRDAIAKDRHFAESETPRYLGRAIACLAADPDVARFAGQIRATWDLCPIYGFTDVDGRQPDWGRYFDEVVRLELDRAAGIEASSGQ